MRHTILLAITLLFALPAVFAQSKAGKTDTTKHATFYTCPMHADVVSHQPGKCPTCGMELKALQSGAALIYAHSRTTVPYALGFVPR